MLGKADCMAKGHRHPAEEPSLQGLEADSLQVDDALAEGVLRWIEVLVGK